MARNHSWPRVTSTLLIQPKLAASSLAAQRSVPLRFFDVIRQAEALLVTDKIRHLRHPPWDHPDHLSAQLRRETAPVFLVLVAVP